MISAVDALLLVSPSEGPSPSDVEAARAYLPEIEDFIRKNMRRSGVVMPVDPKRLNPAIAFEIGIAMRLAGWRAEFQKAITTSKIDPRQKIEEFQLTLVPVEEAYAEADKRRHEQTDN